jgi:hypothetical protein
MERDGHHVHVFYFQSTTESSNGEIVKKVHPRKIQGLNFQDAFKTMCSTNPRRKSAVFDVLRGTFDDLFRFYK